MWHCASYERILTLLASLRSLAGAYKGAMRARAVRLGGQGRLLMTWVSQHTDYFTYHRQNGMLAACARLKCHSICCCAA